MFLSQDDFARAAREADENYQDNRLHGILEDTDLTLGVYRQSDGTRRYELATWGNLDEPMLTSTSRSEVSNFIDKTVKR